MFLKCVIYLWILSFAEGNSSQGIRESHELSDPDQKRECPCKLAPKRRSVDVLGLSRAKRYTSSSSTAFASFNADYSKQCNSYGDRIICFRSYKSAIAAPPTDFTCWNLANGGINCTETENLRFLDNNERYFSSPSSSQQYPQPQQQHNPPSYSSPNAQPARTNEYGSKSYSSPNAQQTSGYGQPIDQSINNSQIRPKPSNEPMPKDSDFGAALVSFTSPQQQLNVRVNQPDPYHSH
uniref:Uncharacterized protein n=1 Tax=Ditylenchus dipsaci TaxID=166011 RepID=A0A915EQU6_9BILA